jgi:hypothetical protein
MYGGNMFKHNWIYLFLAIILSFSLALFVVSCSDDEDDDNGGNGAEATVVGEWKLVESDGEPAEMEEYMYFKEGDGVTVVSYTSRSVECVEGTYVISNGNITLTMLGVPFTGTITFSNDDNTITMNLSGAGETMILKYNRTTNAPNPNEVCEGNWTNPEGTMTAKIDNADWTATLAYASADDGVMVVVGSAYHNNQFYSLGLLFYEMAEGEYDLGLMGTNAMGSLTIAEDADDQDPDVYTTMHQSGSGSATISELTDLNVMGSFSFTAIHSETEEAVVVTDGSFDVEIVEDVSGFYGGILRGRARY